MPNKVVILKRLLLSFIMAMVATFSAAGIILLVGKIL